MKTRNATFIWVWYTHNGFSQIKIFTKCLTSIKSSWAEICLVENMLLTEHFYSMYILCLTRNKQKTPYPKCRVYGTQKEGSGEGKPSALSPHMGHCTGMGNPSQTSAQHQVAHQHWVLEVRQAHLCMWKPVPCIKTPTSLMALTRNSPTLLSLETGHCWGQRIL